MMARRAKPEYLEKTVAHSHFDHYKFHMDHLQIKPVPPQ
jgi:hypothetical protein